MFSIAMFATDANALNPALLYSLQFFFSPESEYLRLTTGFHRTFPKPFYRVVLLFFIPIINPAIPSGTRTAHISTSTRAFILNRYLLKYTPV